jgi:hypothetical protein
MEWVAGTTSRLLPPFFPAIVFVSFIFFPLLVAEDDDGDVEEATHLPPSTANRCPAQGSTVHNRLCQRLSLMDAATTTTSSVTPAYTSWPTGWPSAFIFIHSKHNNGQAFPKEVF